MRPESGVAGQWEIPPVPTSAIRCGTLSAARRIASPNAQARCNGARGGPWQLMLTGYDGDIELRGQEVQGHHDAVIEFPFLGVGHIHRLHDLLDEQPGKRGIARNATCAQSAASSGSSMGPWY